MIALIYPTISRIYLREYKFSTMWSMIAGDRRKKNVDT